MSRVPKLRVRSSVKTSIHKGISAESGKWRARWNGVELGAHLTEEAAFEVVKEHIRTGVVPKLRGSSIHKGVSAKANGKWTATWNGVRLGCAHLTEEAAFEAVEEHIRTGVTPELRVLSSSSMHKGVSATENGKWRAQWNGVGLGRAHLTEEAAFEVVKEHIRTGVTPKLRVRSAVQTSIHKGVFATGNGKWSAQKNGVRLGRAHLTEEAAFEVVKEHIRTGVTPKRRVRSSVKTSIHKGVSATGNGKWSAQRNGLLLGSAHLTEEAAFEAIEEQTRTGVRDVRYGRQRTSKYKHVIWSSVSPGKWLVALCMFGGKSKRFVAEDDAARWYNSEASRLGRPLIEGVPDAPDYSLNEILKRHLV